MGELKDKLEQEFTARSKANPGEKDKEPTLEEIIEKLDNAEAKDALRLQLRLRKAEYETRIAELEARVKRGGNTQVGAEDKPGGNTGEKPKRWTVVEGKPIEDPEGEYETFAQAYKVAALDAAEKGDPMALFRFLKEEGVLGGKTDQFQETFLRELARKSVDALVNPPQNRPPGGTDAGDRIEAELAALKREIATLSDPVMAAQRTKALIDVFKSLGVITEGAGQGQTIDQLKETHRHQERLEELKTDKEYKQKVGNAWSELPERIGRGIASQVGEEEDTETTSVKKQQRLVEPMICDCGAKFQVPIDAKEVTCPQCGQIWDRKEKGAGDSGKK